MNWFAILIVVSISTSMCLSQLSDASETDSDLAAFRSKREESLKKNWLTLVGLDWLKDGENLVGSAPGSGVRLPDSAPRQLAKIIKTRDKKYEIEFIETSGVRIDGKPAKASARIEMKTDLAAAGKPTTVEVGTIKFHLAERGPLVGVRSQDQNSVSLKNFKGVRWFPANNELQVKAKYVKFKEARTVKYQDVLNQSHEEQIYGSVEFTVDGQKVTLLPVSEDGGLEFIFRDTTSGTESYGAARYLSAPKPNDKNEVVIDFNKATNPPCAYTSFATCPLAPAENNLRVAIRAGEMKPLDNHH